MASVRNGWKADIEHAAASDYARLVTSDQRTPWIAILHVRPLTGRTGGLHGAPGAYASVLALARDEADYREMVAAEMEKLGLFVAETEDLEPYEPRADDSENVQLCAARLSPEWPVQYHDFNSYPRDEA